jgi:hypothetical protein
MHAQQVGSGDFWVPPRMLCKLCHVHSSRGPPLRASGQSSWLQIQRSQVLFPALPDYLRSNGSGTRSTQPREYNWVATWKKYSGSSLVNGLEDLLCWPHDTFYLQKVGSNVASSGSWSVSIVHSQTETTEFVCFFFEKITPVRFIKPSQTTIES